MTFRVERTDYDPQDGFLYYVAFKPTLELEKDEIHARIPVEAMISLTETGNLADLTFEVPKTCRTEHALSFFQTPEEVSYIEPKMFVVMRGQNGDTVITAPAKLDLDLAGRIVGMEIQWSPSDHMPTTDKERLDQLQSSAAEIVERNERRPATLPTPARRCES